MLAEIDAAFAEIGMTAVDGAMTSFECDCEELAYMASEAPNSIKPMVTAERHKAADLWESLEQIAILALGKDRRTDTLPGFVGRIEPASI